MALLERVATLVRANLNDLIDHAEDPEKMIKLAEAQSKCDVLIAQHRRSRALGKANSAQLATGGESSAATFDRMKNKVRRAEAVSQATAELMADDVDDRFAAMEKQEQIDKLLADLKAKRGA